MEFVPQLREVLKRGLQSGNAAKVAAAKGVEAELNKVLRSDAHRWFLGQMTPAEREARRKASEEFKKRYAQ
jgi:hypothetical protein